MKHWASETLAMSKLKQKNHQWRTQNLTEVSHQHSTSLPNSPPPKSSTKLLGSQALSQAQAPVETPKKKTADRLTETTPLRRGAEDGQNVAKCIWISGSVSPGFLELSPPILTPAAAVPQAPYRLSSLSAPCSFGRFLKDPLILELVYPGTQLLTT